jgi:metallo-beta-lactamase family protein
VVVAAGMVTGGRILSYLERYISLPETTVIIVGYQAEGRKLLEGPKKLRFMESIIPLKQRFEIEGLSAHADQKGCSIGSELENKPKSISSSW